MARGACHAINKLAFKDCGIRSNDYRSVAAELNDNPVFEGVRFHFSDSKGFYFRMLPSRWLSESLVLGFYGPRGYIDYRKKRKFS
jgi:hypothetical protein